MAHFAELNETNTVLRVIVVDNKDTVTANGTEKESIGIAHCERCFGGRWVQTSYNSNFRRMFAGVGCTYDETLDVFIPPKPFPSWALDSEGNWQAPTAMPTDGAPYHWDEGTLSWITLPEPTPPTE